VILVQNGSETLVPRLEQAVEQAGDGATIRLAPTEHRLSAPLKITKSLSLVGLGPEQCQVTCDIQGFVTYFSSAGRSTTWFARGIRFEHVGATWANVLQADSGRLHLENCVVTGAVCKQEGDNFYGGTGLFAWGNAEVTATNCWFYDNRLHGVGVAGSATVTLENNTFENNAQDGILFFGNGSGMVRKNLVRSNGLDGIGVCQSACPTLEENRCEGNKRYGIGFFDSATGLARKNTCGGNDQGEIYCASTAAPKLESNSGSVIRDTPLQQPKKPGTDGPNPPNGIEEAMIKGAIQGAKDWAGRAMLPTMYFYYRYRGDIEMCLWWTVGLMILATIIGAIIGAFDAAKRWSQRQSV
jgi:parallel beta-helix repeat protein